MRDNQYFAAVEDEQELLNELNNRIREYYQDLESTGLSSVYQRIFRAYHGGRITPSAWNESLFESSKLSRGGSQGELTNLKADFLSNTIQHAIGLVSNQKPAMKSKAVNTDYKSQSQTILADGLLEYYLSEKKFHGDFIQVLENSCLYGEGSIHCPWNPTAGDVYDYHPETNAPIHEGDLEPQVLSPLELVRDINLSSADHDWVIIKGDENRFNLAAKYPEQAEAVFEAGANHGDPNDSFRFALRSNTATSSSDRVPVWTFYHRITEAMPEGRVVIFTDSAVLYDGPIPYDRIPVFSMQPRSIKDSPYGFSHMWALLAPQQALDILSSTIMSNQATGGLNNLWSKAGDNMSVRQLDGGLRHLQSEEPPQPIAFARTPAEIFNFRQTLIQEIRQLSGLNDTAVGNPPSNIQSGTAMALMVSQAVSFASNLEQAYYSIIEDVGTEIINQLKTFAKTPRIATIVGNANRSYLKEFTSDDLSAVSRVHVEQVNPMAKSIAGRTEIANNLLQQGFIKTPDQYIAVLSSGRLDPAIQGTQHELLSVQSENEVLREGGFVQALITDMHADHIREHKSVLADPEARSNPDLVANVLAHIQEHLDLWRSADPAILMITGQEPPPPDPNQVPPPESIPSQGQPMTPDPSMAPAVGPSPEQLPNLPNLPSVPPNSPDGQQDLLEQALPTEGIF